jgi:hypothetical protein
MAIEIVHLPIKNGDFPWLCKRLPEGKCFFLEVPQAIYFAVFKNTTRLANHNANPKKEKITAPNF